MTGKICYVVLLKIDTKFWGVLLFIKVINLPVFRFSGSRAALFQLTLGMAVQSVRVQVSCAAYRGALAIGFDMATSVG